MGSNRDLYRPDPDSCLVSENMSIYTTRLMLTWRKMTVAVCLVVALRTIDLRCADMTEKLKPAARKWRDACSLAPQCGKASSVHISTVPQVRPCLSQSQSYLSTPDSNGK
jgi:hypothetical protein